MNRNRCLIVMTLVLLVGLLQGCRQTEKRGPAAAGAPIDDARRLEHVESFDKVWTTIRDQHWDKNLNGVDWDAARAELRPKVEAAKNDAEARAAMEELISRLKQSHFGVIPAEAYEKMGELPRGEEDDSTSRPATARAGASGIHVRVVGDDAVVTKVDAGSAGEAAGVKPGWLVVRVGKFETRDILSRVRAAQKDSNLLHAYQSMTMQQLLMGDVDEKRVVAFRDGRGKLVRKTLTLGEMSGTPAKFGNLPTMYITTDVREAAPDVGYVAFSAFFDPDNVSTRFREAVNRFSGAEGLIIDLRGNPGGIGFMANGMAGSLVDKPGLQLGEMTMRSGTLKFVIFKQPEIYSGPVAVLVDECSMSTSEIMAGGLKDLGRARIFGTQTPGAALPSRIEKLPNGDGFQYAFANYVSAKGDVLEGKGVTPDEAIPPRREALLAGRDPVVDAAVAWIKSQKKS